MSKRQSRTAGASQYRPRALRILHVTPFFPPDKGGIANHLQNLCSTLLGDGNNVTVVAPSASRPDSLPEKIGIRSVHPPGWPYPTLRSLSIPLDFGRKINSLVKSGKYDLVHAHGHHYPMTWFAIQSAQKHKVPCVLTLHGMFALNPGVLGGRTRIEEWFNALVFRRLLSKTTAVIGLTNQITDYARKYGPANSRYFTIANGVNSQVFRKNLPRKQEFRKKYGLSDSKKVVLFVGRFEQVKAVLEFVAAAKRVLDAGAKVEFLVIGAGSLEQQVRQDAANVSGIRVLPWQAPQNIHEFYIASDIFAIPSRFEALPLTVIEAMAAGLHIVYTPVGGVPEILQGYDSKTILHESSPAAIKAAIAKLAQEDLLQKRYNSKLIDAFDWENIGHATSSVYDQIA